MVDFYDLNSGRVVARSRAVKVVNGKIVPDSLGLPALVEAHPCDRCWSQSDPDGDECYYCSVAYKPPEQK